MSVYYAIGLMSGSSLDGVDLAYCKFILEKDKWDFELLQTACIPYPADILEHLQNVRNKTAEEIFLLDAELGAYYASLISNFINQHNLNRKVAVIGSHGHTVFHFPANNWTLQIGCGATLYANTGIPVVCDLRKVDVALGGQGAPIVPIADKFLFSQFTHLLNVGGIANVTILQNKTEKAFDICVANQVFNSLANRAGKSYDAGGEMAKSGAFHELLFQELNQLSYYQLPFPKSLDNGFSAKNIFPIFEKYKISTIDLLHTYSQHISFQIAQVCRETRLENGKLFVTGGGAYNDFLLHLITFKFGINIEKPSSQLIEFKEALAMAFMAVLRIRGENNVLKEFTGASADSLGGALFGNYKNKG